MGIIGSPHNVLKETCALSNSSLQTLWGSARLRGICAIRTFFVPSCAKYTILAVNFVKIAYCIFCKIIVK